MTPDPRATACDVGDDGVPSCSTGPFRRLTWTLGQLAEILHLRRGRTGAR